MKWSRDLTALAMLIIALAFAGQGTVLASSQPGSSAVPSCYLTLSSERIPLDRGAIFRRDFTVDLTTCTFIAGPLWRLTTEEIAKLHDQTYALGSTRSMTQDTGSPVLPADPIVYERESTWDCCGLELTYVDHQQTYSYDGSNSSVSQIVTQTYARTDGWSVTSQSQWFNTGNPASSVSTEGGASFNNPYGPGQPCDHTLYAEVRSYADGSWTHSSAFIGDPGQTICSGLVHVSEIWGTR